MRVGDVKTYWYFCSGLESFLQEDIPAWILNLPIRHLDTVLTISLIKVSIAVNRDRYTRQTDVTQVSKDSLIKELMMLSAQMNGCLDRKIAVHDNVLWLTFLRGVDSI